MDEARQTKAQLLNELHTLRERVAVLSQAAQSRPGDDRFRLLFDAAPDPILLIDETHAFVAFNRAALDLLGASSIEQIYGLTPDQLSPEFQPDGERSSIKAQRMIQHALARGQLRFEWVHQRLDGSAFTVEVSLRVATADGRPRLITFWRDITARKQAEVDLQQSYALLEQQALLQSQILEIGNALRVDLDLDSLLRQVCVAVTRALGYRVAVANLLDEDGVHLRVRAQAGVPPDEVSAIEQAVYDWPKFQEQFLADRYQRAGCYFVPEGEFDWAAFEGTLFPSLIDPPSGPQQWHARDFLFVPIETRDRGLVGVLSVDEPLDGNRPTLDQLHALRIFANLVGAAVQNAQSHSQTQRYAADLERRVAERTAELARERTRLEAILDSVDEAIYYTNPNGSIRYANAATSRITGYTFDDMAGRMPRELWGTTATLDAAHAELDRAFASGTSVYGLDVINRHKAGHLYHARLSMTALHDADGSLLGFTIAQRDITQLKELDHLKSQFTSRIGHELRTPLTSLMIYLDLLEHGKPEKRDKYLWTLNREADRLRRLIEGFMRMSELDALPAPPDLIAVDLNEIVAGMLLKQRSATAGRQIELEPQLDPALPRVLAEPSMLADAIERLLDNAVAYTPDGGHITVITTVVVTDQQRQAALKIIDSGPGFSPTDQLHLFERFYRGEAARDYTTPGAGLSLAICQTIAKQLRGSLTVHNQAGQGAAVTLRLALAP